ncbi:MAG: hypothetical protein U0984_04630 [Prosthecobacter sp.]|nr:hypothetical protein [Prosthecobacter sp.]
MKSILAALALLLAVSPTGAWANPELPKAVAQSFGAAVAANLLLLKGSGTTTEPLEWTAYARDAFRPSTILRIAVKPVGSEWKATAAGAGGNILNPVPPHPLDFSRLKYRSADARAVAAKAAALAQATFVSVDYQLAANATGVPEWGLALQDDTGYEIGFCVVSGETGALTFQNWTPRYQSREATAAAESEGERAGNAVKRAARKAWNWTDNARKETHSFFRELFR